MASLVLSSVSANITALKIDPMGTVNNAHGKPMAILRKNKPLFYLVPPKCYEAILDSLDDEYLTELVKTRAGEKEIKVDINELLSNIH